jgi:hypothetical protein
MNTQKTTNQKFKSLYLVISSVLILLIASLIATLLIETSNQKIDDFLDILGSIIIAWLIPGLIILGVIWFCLTCINYYRNNSYKKERVNLKKEGLINGLTWYLLVQLGVITLFLIGFDGNCSDSIFSKATYPCSFWHYITTGFELLFWLISQIFALAPVIMFTVGYVIDRKIKNNHV